MPKSHSPQRVTPTDNRVFQVFVGRYHQVRYDYWCELGSPISEFVSRFEFAGGTKLISARQLDRLIALGLIEQQTEVSTGCPCVRPSPNYTRYL
jgi:hypothetical protein